MINEWKLELHYNQESLGNVRVRNGILQGDSFSPLLFVMCIDCISKQLENNIEPIKIKDDKEIIKFSHTLYMDDLKIVVNNMEQAEKADNIVRRIFKAIGMKVNDDKCGIMNNTKEEISEQFINIPIVDDVNPYKYLGVELGTKVSVQKYCDRLIKAIDEVISGLDNGEISSFNLIYKINTDIISKLRYGFSVIPWKMTDLDKLDKEIRKALMKLNMYSKLFSKDRLYVNKDNLGFGLLSCRHEYGKELLRVYLKYKWFSDTKIINLINLTNNTPMGIMKRCKKALQNIIRVEEIEVHIRKNEEDKDMDKVLDEIQELINKEHIKRWENKKSFTLPKMFNNRFINIKPTIQAWKLLNIKKNAFIQIVKMQENAMFIGGRKAAITRNEKDKYCFHCDNEIATIPHILLSCSLTKKNQIARHDYICLEIYKKIIKNYCEMDAYDNNEILPKCVESDDKNITVTFNKDIIQKDVRNILARRPDIYIEDRGKRKGYIIDVTIVKEERIKKAYIDKINKYRRLQEKLRRERDLKFVFVIPVVLTINGFIHKRSVDVLNNELKLKINFDEIIKNTLVNEMKDLMSYISGENSCLSII